MTKEQLKQGKKLNDSIDYLKLKLNNIDSQDLRYLSNNSYQLSIPSSMKSIVILIVKSTMQEELASLEKRLKEL